MGVLPHPHADHPDCGGRNAPSHWRYAHLSLFGAIAAVGAGLRVAADGVEHQALTLLQIALALAVPVGCVVALVFLIWSVLHPFVSTVTHVPLFVCTLIPLAAAIVVAPS